MESTYYILAWFARYIIGRLIEDHIDRIKALLGLMRMPLLLQVTACAMIDAMRRPDRYDYIGIAIVLCLVAIWVLHFVLPSPPPEPPGFQDGIGGPLASGFLDRIDVWPVRCG